MLIYVDRINFPLWQWQPRLSAHDPFPPLTLLDSQTVTATGIASAEAFGTASLSVTSNILPPSIDGEEAFGTPRITITVGPTGIVSLEAFGTPSLTEAINVSGIPSEEAFGNATIVGNVTVDPSGIASEEAFGTAELTVFFPTQTITVDGIVSLEEFGIPEVSVPPIPPIPPEVLYPQPVFAIGLPIGSTSIISPLFSRGAKNRISPSIPAGSAGKSGSIMGVGTKGG